ncbi:hypothetical protein HZ326_2180 [Fusarium oxysporum f. sp. albedinis]|nr:hypothetical protein HZ326_2180 [Fusarium oxysporum f. sp. albedinis]
MNWAESAPGLVESTPGLSSAFAAFFFGILRIRLRGIRYGFAKAKARWGSGYCPMNKSIGTVVITRARKTWVPTLGQHCRIAKKGWAWRLSQQA